MSALPDWEVVVSAMIHLKLRLKIALFVLASLLLTGSLLTNSLRAQAPAAEAQKPNPVKPTPESLAKGKKIFNVDCALCHGEHGDGKGDMASDIKNIPDLTNPDVQKNSTDGQWFQIIRKGKGDMPPEDTGRAKDEDVWNLVNYIRSFGKK